MGACRNADAQVPPSQSLIQQVEGEVQGLQVLEMVTQVVISLHFGIHQASELWGLSSGTGLKPGFRWPVWDSSPLQAVLSVNRSIVFWN